MEESKNISRDAPSSLRGHHTPPVPLAKAPPLSDHSNSFDIEDATERIDAAGRPEVSLDSAFEHLKLTDKTPMPLFSMIGAVFQQVITQDALIDLGVNDWRARLEDAEKLSQNGRKDIEALRSIRIMLDHLWSLELKDGLFQIASLLADGSRERESRTEKP